MQTVVLRLFAGLLLAQFCYGTMKCAMYIMDKPGNPFGKMYVGKELEKPAIDCSNPNADIMKAACSKWFGKVNGFWSLDAPSRSRGAPFTIADDLCRVLKTSGNWTFGAFYMYCDKMEPMFTGKTREDSTLCCKDGAPC